MTTHHNECASLLSNIYHLIELMVADADQDSGSTNNKPTSISDVLNVRVERTRLFLRSPECEQLPPPGPELSFNGDDAEVTSWNFVKCALYVMDSLRWGIEQHHTVSSPAPDLMSVYQQKIFSQLLEFVVALGLCPGLEAGVGVPLSSRAHLAGTELETLVCEREQGVNYERLMVCVEHILKLRSVSTLWTHVVSRYLNDVLGALLQTSFSDISKRRVSNENRDSCYESLKSVVKSTYTPLLVRELLVLQGGFSATGQATGAGERQAPVWLTRACGRLLSGCLMRRNGVILVVRGILETCGNESNDMEISPDWRRNNAIANVISTPSKLAQTTDAYYQTVIPQILDLLLVDDDALTGKQLNSVAGLAISKIISHKYSVAETYILPSLLAPILRACSADGSSMNVEDNDIVFSETSLTTCIGNIFKVYVNTAPHACGNTSSTCIVLSVINPIFSIYTFTLNGVSMMRTQCEGILLKFLDDQVDEAASTLYRLSLGQPVSSTGHVLNKHCVLQYCDEGGVRVTFKTVESGDVVEELCKTLETQDSCCEAIISLLTCRQSSNLPGEFMLHLLKELPSILAVTDTQTREGTIQYNKLVLFGLLSRLCDQFGPSVLQNHSQMLQFLHTTMQRLAELSTHSGDGDDDGEMSDISCETFTLVAGFLSALSPEYNKLTSENKILVKNMVPLIRKFSSKCDNIVVRQMADGLCITLATHGAVRADLTGLDPGTGGKDPGTEGKDPGTEGKTSMSCDSCCKENSDCVYMSALVEGYNPLLPVRAHGLRTLAQLILNKQQCAAIHRDDLLRMFMSAVEDDDQYLYLAAAQGLSALAQTYPHTTLRSLLKQVSQFHDRPIKTERTVKVRLILAEALMKAIRGLGEMLAHHSDEVIGALLVGVRDVDYTVRASSLSNIAEVCQLLKYKLESFISELLNCLHCVLQSDKSVEVRRAAVFVLTKIFTGLGNTTVLVLDTNMRDIYRLLKHVRTTDTDDVCKLHAEQALDCLDEIMRQYMFPKQSLSKKITVLPSDQNDMNK